MTGNLKARILALSDDELLAIMNAFMEDGAIASSTYERAVNLMSASNSRNLQLRKLDLAGDEWVDVMRRYPLLIGHHALIKVSGDRSVKIASTKSARPPVLGQVDTFAPGEGCACFGTNIWVKGDGATLEVSRVDLA